MHIAVASESARVSYVREHTVGSAVHDAVVIAFRNASEIILPFVIMMLPGYALQRWAMVNEEPALVVIGTLISLFSALVAYAVLTITVSDVCLGNKPTISRPFAEVFQTTLAMRLIWANLLQVLAIGVGILLLVIPGIIAMLWYMFSPAVVVIEGRSGIEALTRSRALARGYNLRHLGLLALTLALAMGVGILVGVAGTLLGVTDPFIFSMVTNLIMLVFQSVILVAIILFYYDLRVRKEAYSPELLAEDLRR
jgi:hypothetical protein